MIPVVIVGGNINSKLNAWLKHLGVKEFNHMSTRIDNISPLDIEESAEYLRNMLPSGSLIISVGPLADRLLNVFFVVHGALPSTRTTDKKKIETALLECRNYLQMRNYYAFNYQPSGPRTIG